MVWPRIVGYYGGLTTDTNDVIHWINKTAKYKCICFSYTKYFCASDMSSQMNILAVIFNLDLKIWIFLGWKKNSCHYNFYFNFFNWLPAYLFSADFLLVNFEATIKIFPCARGKFLFLVWSVRADTNFKTGGKSRTSETFRQAENHSLVFAEKKWLKVKPKNINYTLLTRIFVYVGIPKTTAFIFLAAIPQTVWSQLSPKHHQTTRKTIYIPL